MCFADIDECKVIYYNNCDQLCVNIPGSFVCNCTSGYYLAQDGGSCIGKCVVLFSASHAEQVLLQTLMNVTKTPAAIISVSIRWDHTIARVTLGTL